MAFDLSKGVSLGEPKPEIDEFKGTFGSNSI